VRAYEKQAIKTAKNAFFGPERHKNHKVSLFGLFLTFKKEGMPD
jgi:hypothetical protein